jgi:hypothetical protein
MRPTDDAHWLMAEARTGRCTELEEGPNPVVHQSSPPFASHAIDGPTMLDRGARKESFPAPAVAYGPWQAWTRLP